MAGGATIAWAQTHVGTRAQARRLVQAILNERLAACANMHPVESVFWWKGKKVEAKEFALVFKTAPDGLARLVKRLRLLHPYEVPYLAWGRNETVLPEYAAWVSAQTTRHRQPRPRRCARR